MPRRGTAIAAWHFQCRERVDLYGPRAEGTVDSLLRAISLRVNSAVPAGLLEPEPDFPVINRRATIVVSLPGQVIPAYSIRQTGLYCVPLKKSEEPGDGEQQSSLAWMKINLVLRCIKRLFP